MMFLKSRDHAEQPPQEDDNGNPKDDVSVSSSVMKLALPEHIDDLANFGFSAVDASDGESLGTAVDPAFIDATDVASIDEPAAGSLSSREWLVVSPTKSCFSAYRSAAKWDVNNISAGYRPSAPPLPKLGGLPNSVFRRAPQNRISHQEGHPYRVPPPRSRLFTPGFAALHRTGFDVGGQTDVSTIHVCQVDDSIPSTSLGLQQLTTRISYSHCQSMEQAYDKAKATQIEKWCRVVRSAGNHSSLLLMLLRVRFGMLISNMLLNHLPRPLWRSTCIFRMSGLNIVLLYKLTPFCQFQQWLQIFSMHIVKAHWGPQSIGGKDLAGFVVMQVWHIYWIAFKRPWSKHIPRLSTPLCVVKAHHSS